MFLRGFFSTHGFLGFSNGALDQTGIWLKPQTCLHQNHIVLSIQVVQALKIEGSLHGCHCFLKQLSLPKDL